MPTQAWEAGQRAGAELDAQTAEMAAKLEAEGIATRRQGREASHVVLLGAVTGVARPVTEYRALRFLPAVAKRERGPMLAALTYFQRHNASGPHLRFGVVTAGARVPFGGDLRGTIEGVQRRVSRWASLASARFGMSVVFRCTEFTVDDALTFHPHVNVLYAPRVVLPPEEWQAFLSWSGEFFGAHWRDAGVLAKPEEALKYPFKPADTAALSSAQLAWLFEQLHRLKLAQPLGQFAAFAAEVKASGQRVRRVASPDGPPRLVRVSTRKREGRTGEQRSAPAEAEGENVILAHTAPVPLACPYAEPGILVRNYTPHPTTEGGRLRLAMIEDRGRQAREAWHANGAPAPEAARNAPSVPETHHLR